MGNPSKLGAHPRRNNVAEIATFARAQEEVSYGADLRHWPDMARFAAAHGLTFSASVGPGYNDTKIRPWNQAATR